MVNRKSQAPGDNPGFVYLIRRGIYYKVGHAVNLEARLKVMPGMTTPYKARQYPIELVWSLYCTDKITAERALQQRFAAQYSGIGEWYFLSDADVEWIISRSEREICADYDALSYTRPMRW